MMRILKWSVAAVLLLVVALLARMPAETAYAHAQQQVAPLKLSGIQGSVWQGSARNGEYGQLLFDTLRWDWQPLSALALSMGYQLSAFVSGADIEADVRLKAGERVELENATVNWTLEQLMEAFNAPRNLGTMSAKLAINVDQAEIVEGNVESISGRALLSDLQHGGLKDLVIGDFAIEARMDGEKIIADAKDVKGVLEMNIKFQLDPQGNFQVTGFIRPKDAAPRELRQLLPLFGRRQSDGSFRIDRKGGPQTQSGS